MKNLKNKIIALFIMFIGINPCYAENWIPIKSFDGKVAEIDTESVIKNNENFEFNVRLLTSYNYYTVNKFVIDLKTKSFAQVSTTTFENGVITKYAEAKELKYKPVRTGSIQENFYKTMLLLTGSINIGVKQVDMEKYLKNQQKKIIKNWNPSNYNYNANKNWLPTTEGYITLIIDKHGNIISYKYNNIHQNTISTIMKSDFYHIINSKIKKFDELPKNYNSDMFVMFVKILYPNNKNIPDEVKIKNNYGVGYITVSKTSSSLGKTVKDTGFTLLSVPFAVLSPILEN